MLGTLERESVHAVVTDPPYELGFMGRAWDGTGVAFQAETWRAVYDVLKPGAHLVAFGGTRTFHRMAVAIEDAGFETRDTLCWMYGVGFPKSLDVSKAIDRAAGATREVVGPSPWASRGGAGLARSLVNDDNWQARGDGVTAPSTPEAQQWAGWGTALKPAWEPIILARKPLIGTVASNVLAHGTGALNIDATRVPTSPGVVRNSHADNRVCTCYGHGVSRTPRNGGTRNRASSSSERAGHASPPSNAGLHGPRQLKPQGSLAGYRHDLHSDDGYARLGVAAVPTPSLQQPGEGMFPGHCAKCGHIRADLSKPFGTMPNVEQNARWPANVVHSGDEEVEAAFAAFGERPGATSRTPSAKQGVTSFGAGNNLTIFNDGSNTSASRFFYSAKASAADRAGSKHPTVKPLTLMRWLCRMVTPPGGTVLDPFAGSGTTLQAAVECGFDAIGIEMDATYCSDIKRRMARVQPAFV